MAKQVIRLAANVRKALGKRLLERFEAMSFSHRREWVVVIEEAKKEETRRGRIGKLVEAMRLRE